MSARMRKISNVNRRLSSKVRPELAGSPIMRAHVTIFDAAVAARFANDRHWCLHFSYIHTHTYTIGKKMSLSRPVLFGNQVQLLDSGTQRLRRHNVRHFGTPLIVKFKLLHNSRLAIRNDNAPYICIERTSGNVRVYTKHSGIFNLAFSAQFDRDEEFSCVVLYDLLKPKTVSIYHARECIAEYRAIPSFIITFSSRVIGLQIDSYVRPLFAIAYAHYNRVHEHMLAPHVHHQYCMWRDAFINELFE